MKYTVPNTTDNKVAVPDMTDNKQYCTEDAR